MHPKMRVFLYRVGLLIGIGIFVYQLWTGWVTFLAKDLSVNLFRLLIAYILFTIAYWLQMVNWSLLLKLLNYPISVSDSIHNYTLTFLPRYIPGSIWGYLSRSEWLKMNHAVPYRVSSLASILEAALLLGIAAMWSANHLLMANSVALWGLGLFNAVFIGVIIGTFHIVIHLPKVLSYTAHWFRVSESWVQILLGIIFIYSSLWLLNGLGLLYLLGALIPGAYEWDISYLMATTFAISGAWSAGFLIFVVPSGIGIREFSMYSLLDYTGLFILDAVTIATVLSRLLLMFAELTWLLIQIGIQKRQPID